MNVYVLVYDGFAQFEVVLANYFLSTKMNIITVGITSKMVTSMEGFQTVPHSILEDLSFKDIDLFIIPGGDPTELFEIDSFYTFLKSLNNANKKIAAICAGTAHLAKAGILNDKKFTTSLAPEKCDYFDRSNFIDTNVVQDGNLITSKGNGYVDFALKLGEVMNIYENDSDYQETVRYFKEFKDWLFTEERELHHITANYLVAFHSTQIASF